MFELNSVDQMSWREHYSQMWDKNNEENENFRDRMKKIISQ